MFVLMMVLVSYEEGVWVCFDLVLVRFSFLSQGHSSYFCFVIFLYHFFCGRLFSSLFHVLISSSSCSSSYLLVVPTFFRKVSNGTLLHNNQSVLK